MSDITVTIGSRPEPDAEERRQRALRAKEVLSGAGWLFDEYISDMTRDLLGTDTRELNKREFLYFQIDAAAQLKGRLHQIIQTQAAYEKGNERKNRNEPMANHD